MTRRDFLTIGFVGLLALLFGVETLHTPRRGVKTRFKVYTHGTEGIHFKGYLGSQFYETGILYAPYVPLEGL